MKHSTKNTILKLPIIGRLAAITHAILVLPKRNHEIYSEILSSKEKFALLQKSLDQFTEDTSKRFSALLKSTDNLSQQLAFISKLEGKSKSKEATSKSTGDLFAEDHLADVFYANFEDKFRGTEEEISRRISTDYLSLFKKSGLDYNKFPILDIGSGRGEFLSLMKANKLNARGIDINTDMVERSKNKGLDAVEGDATEHLSTAKPQSYGAVTGFHIVEHIPFNQLLRLFTAVYAALAEGGFVLFETPNPENIIVGSYSFYLDPSHLNPVPPDLLAFALENCGFRNIEIRRLHPSEELKSKTNLPSDLMEKIYGPRDYCVIAYK